MALQLYNLTGTALNDLASAACWIEAWGERSRLLVLPVLLGEVDVLLIRVSFKEGVGGISPVIRLGSYPPMELGVTSDGYSTILLVVLPRGRPVLDVEGLGPVDLEDLT